MKDPRQKLLESFELDQPEFVLSIRSIFDSNDVLGIYNLLENDEALSELGFVNSDKKELDKVRVLLGAAYDEAENWYNATAKFEMMNWYDSKRAQDDSLPDIYDADDSNCLVEDWESLVINAKAWDSVGALNPNVPNLYIRITNTGNAAFVDVGRDAEIARIINAVADMVQDQSIHVVVDAMVLRDLNGNDVGKVTSDDLGLDYLDPGDALLSLCDMDGAAFTDDPSEEVSRLLREAATKIENGDNQFSLYDINGNKVGGYAYRPEPSLEIDGVIDMSKALDANRVFIADDGFNGLADGEYRFIVTSPEFEPLYGDDHGSGWLVNAKGEVLEYLTDIKSTSIDSVDANKKMKADLMRVIAGDMTCDDFERQFDDDFEL